jgi:hypothetical protein
MKTNFDKINCLVFGYIFAAIAILAFIGGCVGNVWHFYTSVLCAMVAAMIFYTVRKESKAD